MPPAHVSHSPGINLTDPQLTRPGSYNSDLAYAQSKLANVRDTEGHYRGDAWGGAGHRYWVVVMNSGTGLRAEQDSKRGKCSGAGVPT